MTPKQLIVPVERGCNPKGYPEVVNGCLHLALGEVYVAKDVVILAD